MKIVTRAMADRALKKFTRQFNAQAAPLLPLDNAYVGCDVAGMYVAVEVMRDLNDAEIRQLPAKQNGVRVQYCKSPRAFSSHNF